MSTASLFLRWIDEVWNQSNLAYLNEVLDEHVIVHGRGTTGTAEGKEAFLGFYQSIKQNFPELHLTNTIVSETDSVATCYCIVTGRSVRNAPVNFTGLCAGRFEGEKLVEMWTVFDFLKMYQQLGHIIMSELED